MPSKRGWRAMGAALMETGRQVHLSRAEKLEQQKADNLMALGQERNTLMGEQNDIAREGQAAQATYRQRDLEIKGENQERQAEQAALNTQFRMDSMNNDAELRKIMIQSQSDSKAAQALYQQAALGFQEKQLNMMEAKDKLTNLRTFVNEDIPKTVNSYLNIADIEKAKLREAALASALEAGAMSMEPKQFDKFIQNINENVGSTGDVTKLDKAAFGKMFNELRAKKNILGIDIDNGDLLAVVQGRKQKEAAAGQVPTSTSIIGDLQAGRSTISERSETFTGEAGLFADSLMGRATSDPVNAADFIMQSLATPGLMQSGAYGGMSQLTKTVKDGDPEGLATLAEALKLIEANWPAYATQYDLGNLTFAQAAPRIKAELGIKASGGF